MQVVAQAQPVKQEVTNMTIAQHTEQKVEQPPEQTATTGDIVTHNGVIVTNTRDAIIESESNGSYDARNGRYIGKYQLDASYLNGDYSPANQDATFERYIQQRYGSYEAAWEWWKVHKWY